MRPPGAAPALVRADDVPLFTQPSILRTNPAHLPALGGPACFATSEERNRELSTTSKRTNALRVGAAVVVLALFLGVGLYLWDAGPGTEGIATGAAQAAQGSVATLVVEPRRMSSTITVVGQLAPRREIEVTSPIKGTVAAVHFQYGERVTEGQRLESWTPGAGQGS